MVGVSGKIFGVGRTRLVTCRSRYFSPTTLYGEMWHLVCQMNKSMRPPFSERCRRHNSKILWSLCLTDSEPLWASVVFGFQEGSVSALASPGHYIMTHPC